MMNDESPRFPDAKIQYAAWSNPETLKKEAEKAIRNEGAKFDDASPWKGR